MSHRYLPPIVLLKVLNQCCPCHYRSEQAEQTSTFSGKNFTADLKGLKPGARVAAYYEEDQMWYDAVVDGIYEAPEPASRYFVVTFSALSGCR